MVYARDVGPSEEEFLEVFASMLRIRRVEEAIAERYTENEMRTPVHLCVGQEGVPVGVSQNLQRSDKVLSGHRSHGQYLAKGGNLRSMLAELYGREGGCSRGRGGSQHLIDLECGFLGSAPVLGSTLAIGVGVAWALRRASLDSVVVTFFGDAATEEGVFAESLDFAALKSLPVLFVCENNQYSVYTHLSDRQFKGRSIVEIGKAHGVQGHQADGNNILEVLSAGEQAIKKVKSGKPYLLELNTYRWLEHCGPNWDDDLGYRNKGELNRWIERCPIKIYEDYLHAEKNFTEQELSSIRTDIQEYVDLAFEKAAAARFPNENVLFEDIYA